MKRIIGIWLLTVLLALLPVLSAGAETVVTINGELEPKTQEETMGMLESAADDYFLDPELKEELSGEISREETELFGESQEYYTLTHDGHTMKFTMTVVGQPDDKDRYPLYIALHGGGTSPAEDNDGEWYTMANYYLNAVQDGIYIACRGITDTWDMHFQEASYPLYDRLIQSMIYLYQADPDRVYLLGFSAGGDGVYQVAPRMADRFAAANMSSGHPNGVSLRNLANCPFSIQVGVRDYYHEEALRCIRGAEFEKVLSGYHDELDYGYEHQVLVRVPAGHNYDDVTDPDAFGPEHEEAAEGYLSEVLTDPAAYADPEITGPMLERFQQAYLSATGMDSVMEMSYYPVGETPEFDQEIRNILTEEFHLETRKVNGSAVNFVSRFVRNPAPETVVWDLGTRAPSRGTKSFYWLRADAAVNSGSIRATAKEGNILVITPENVEGDFSILVNPALVDVSEPIHIETPDGEFEVHVNPSEETIRSSIRETGDPYLAWVAEIPYSSLVNSTVGE